MSKEEREKYEKISKEREGQLKKNKELNDAYTEGTAAMEKKDYDAAIVSLTKASEIDPKQLAVWQHLAEAYVSAAQKKSGAEFEALMAKAIEVYGKALEVGPTDAGTHSNLAIALGKAKKFPEMEAETLKAAELDPHDPRIMNNLGDILRELKRYDEAEPAYRKAIQLDPRFPAPWEGLGTLEIMRNRPSLALPDFEHALELAPNFRRGVLDRALAEELSGNRLAAIADYKTFLARAAADPNLAKQRQMAEQALARLEAGPPNS